MKEILILRVVVGWEVQMEDKKVKVVKEWKIPTKINKKSGKLFKVCRFL